MNVFLKGCRVYGFRVQGLGLFRCIFCKGGLRFGVGALSASVGGMLAWFGCLVPLVLN